MDYDIFTPGGQEKLDRDIIKLAEDLAEFNKTNKRDELLRLNMEEDNDGKLVYAYYGDLEYLKKLGIS